MLASSRKANTVQDGVHDALRFLPLFATLIGEKVLYLSEP